MALFFDKGIGRGKTFLLYGKVKDKFFCNDLVERNIKQFLVRMLKSCGYEHIVFYGLSGNEGNHCLDPVSARFFYTDNAGAPAPLVVSFEETGSAVPKTGAKEQMREINHSEKENGVQLRERTDNTVGAQRSSDAGDIRFMMGQSRRRHRGEYVPGDLSSEYEGPEWNETGTDVSVDVRQVRDTGGSKSIRYALRGQEPEEFFLDIKQKMKDPASKMVVIFDDIFDNPALKIEGLRNAILSTWDNEKNDNLCFILAPETDLNTRDLIEKVKELGLGPKFLIEDKNEGLKLNQLTSFNILNPGADEIRNMLRRLMIVGIPGTGDGVSEKKLVIDYAGMDKIIDEILYCSSVYAGREPNQQSWGGAAGEVYNRLCYYLQNKGEEKMHLEREEIAQVWNMESTNRESALSKLNRPGWENAYSKISEVVSILEANYKNTNKEEIEDPVEEASKHRWSPERMTITEKTEENRMKIPHFILMGNPGVGKSTIARLIGNLLHEIGCLKKGHTVEVTREQLTSSFVAGIPKATRAQIDLAEEGVLFIDEAHALGNNDGGSERSSTGLEVIQTLNGAMTDPRRHFCVVLAGYEEQMQAVFKLDPGFKGRFGLNVIKIDDYSPELLEKILREHIRAIGGSLDDSLTEEHDENPSPLQNMLRRLYRERNRRTFENARAMITLGDNACGKAKDRPVRKEDFFNDQITADWFEKDDMNDSYDKIMKELEEQFVGMEPFKKMFRDTHQEIQENIHRGKKPEDIPMKPLLIVGNPGTGKTTVAKCLARMYHSFNMLGTPIPDFVNASTLVGTHVGESQELVLSHIRDAQDKRGMLVIDEAHELLSSEYGIGAIGACMAPTTDKEHPFMLVMNVYANREEEFMKSNGGNRRRFKVIKLEDYNPDELFEICCRMIEKGGYSISGQAADRLKNLCRQTYYNRKYDTGNGGWCENICEEINQARRRRCEEQQIGFNDEKYKCIEETDIPAPDKETDLDKILPLFKDCRTVEEKLQYLDYIEDRMKKERVGAEPIKAVLEKKIKAMKYNVKYPDDTQAIEPGHYIFKGNAGTGKTTGAEYFARYLHALGLIESAGLREITSTDLIGQYLGETGNKTRQQLMDARNHVTLVDEAYSLSDSNGQADSYKKDALAEIVGFLDDPEVRRDTTMIFAGYSGDMDALYPSNQGLKNRITEISFPDFTNAECTAIFCSMAEEKKRIIDGDALAALEEAIRKLRQRPDFANGRTIRSFFEAVDESRMDRCLREDYSKDDEKAQIILEEDIQRTALTF